jgi:hypothetical protein
MGSVTKAGKGKSRTVTELEETFTVKTKFQKPCLCSGSITGVTHAYLNKKLQSPATTF